jgi:hypothetical protein
MEKKELVPVYTTEAYDEIGVKMTYDSNKNMYVYTATDEEVGEGYHVTTTNTTMLSPEIVNQLLGEGVLSYTNPLDKQESEPDPKGIVYSDQDALDQCKDCIPAYDDLKEVSDMNTFLLEQAINKRLYDLEDKVGQILEALTTKSTKTKK